jgi:hypothetical protein
MRRPDGRAVRHYGRGWPAGRQGDDELGPAAGTVAGGDPPAVGRDDPATNRQAEPDPAAAVRPGRRPAVELLEHPFFCARRQTWAEVGDADLDRRARLAGRDLDRGAGWRVPGRVLQQVHQHLLDQQPVHRDERQVGRDVDPDRPVAQVAGHSVDR